MYLVSIIVINWQLTPTGHFQNWDCRDLKSPELELELELKYLELEMELKLIASSGIGIGIGNNGIGIGIGIELKLDSTRRKASEICLRPPLDIYSHTFSR